MKVEIHNFELADPTMLAACLERVRLFYSPADLLVVPKIWVTQAKRDGMLDYGILLPYAGGGSLLVHAIRRPGSTEVEFHS